MYPFGWLGGSHVAPNDLSESPLAWMFLGGVPGAGDGRKRSYT